MSDRKRKLSENVAEKVKNAKDDDEESLDDSANVHQQSSSESLEQQQQPPVGSRHGHRAPLLNLPCLADFPRLIEPTVAKIFRQTHVPHLKAIKPAKTASQESSVNESGDGSVVEGSRTDILEETWSDFVKRLEGNPHFPTIDPLEALHLQHFRWPGKHCRSPSPGSRSLAAFSENNVIYEKQVITSELDAFITALQQDKKYAISDDGDSLQSTNRSKFTFGGIYFLLGVIVIVFIGNFAAGIYYIRK